MWFGVEIAAYVSLVLGYGLLLVLAIRHRAGRGPAQRLLEIILLLAAVWTCALGLLAFLAPGGWWSFVWHRVAQIGLVVLALLTVELAGAFVQNSSRRWPLWLVVGLLTTAAVVLDLLPFEWTIHLPFLFSARLGRTEMATLLLILAWLSLLAAAWWIGIVAMRRASGAKHLNRIRYLLAALIGFTVGDLLILIGGVPDVYVGLAARLLGFCIITFAILRYDLPDVRNFSLASVRLVLLVGAKAVLYLVALFAVAFASSWLPALPSLALALPFLALALLVAASVDALLSPKLRHRLDRIIMGQDYDLQKALSDYSQRISLILDLERLADTALDWLATTMHVHRAAFMLLTPRGDDQLELAALRITAGSLPQPMLFAADSRFIVHFYKLGRPLSQYDLDMLSWFETMSAGERKWLKELALDLYIPIMIADKPVALLALGPKAGGQPYSETDLDTLMILAGQTATVLENARLMDNLRSVQDDLHRLNTELSETNRQLSRLDQVKTDFITIASHELRTPLTQIYGYSDILGRLDGDDLNDAQAVHEFIEGISRGADRLRQVVDAMIDVSLIETGSLKIHPVLVPIKVIVQNAVETVQSSLKERRLGLMVRDLADLPYIQADGARLEQVFVSLLSNAIKFTPDGGRIVVSGQLDFSSPGEDSVDVLVADTGIGVDPDHRELIFEKFYRAENPMLHSTDSVRFKGAGPGLGLVIAKGIVDAHGGRLWVESPGRNEATCPGSTFHVCLPISGLPKE